jgi:hypothetical protein
MSTTSTLFPLGGADRLRETCVIGQPGTAFPTFVFASSLRWHGELCAGTRRDS